MSEPDSIVLQVLAELRRSVDQTVSGLGEMKATLRLHGATLDRVLVQTTKTNGRVDALEDRVDMIERRELREASIADGREQQREAYRSTVTRALELVWSPLGKGAGALALLLAGWAIRGFWRW